MMDSSEPQNLRQNSLEQLKSKLKKKLENIKSELHSLNTKLSNNIRVEGPKINSECNRHISDLKDKTLNYVKNKEKKIKEKEIISNVYFEAIRNVKRIEKFEKSLSELILDSLTNYNDFISNKLPYYKNSCHKFLKNHEDKLCNTNIYSKLTKKQIEKIHDYLKNKNLLYFINGKYPINIKILISDNCIEDCLILSSNKFNQVNSVEIDKLNDNTFNDFFKNVRKDKNSKMNEVILKNCELKKGEICQIPFGYKNLKIIDSRIFSSIFNNMSFETLVKLNLDNSQIDSYNFEKILKMILKIQNKNLKEFSAKNNYISRIVLNDEFNLEQNSLVSLELLNLSNNNIYIVDKRILDLIPRIKIFDLSNNSLLHLTNCKELIKNCKGFILLLRNVVIMKEPMYNVYLEYYKNFLSKKENIKYPFDYINFDSLFYKRNNSNILKFDYSFTKKIENISELNLSSCSLDDKNVINILSNCLSIPNNLAKLNISYNLITEKILELLIEDKINALLKNLKELDLSYNLIKFIKLNTYEKPKLNPFVIFLDNYSQLELLILKSTPFEETINEYIKVEVKIHYAKEKKHEVKADKDVKEIKKVIEDDCLNINNTFHLVINDLITMKYTNPKRFRQILPILDRNLIIENLKPEEKK